MAKEKRSLFIQGTPLILIPELAVVLGNSDTAVVLQQFCFWFQVQGNKKYAKRPYPDTDKEVTWIYGTAKHWVTQDFWWMSQRAMAYHLEKLEKWGLLVSSNFNKNKNDRTKWYTLHENYAQNFHNLVLQLPREQQDRVIDRLTENEEKIDLEEQRKDEPIPLVSYFASQELTEMIKIMRISGWTTDEYGKWVEPDLPDGEGKKRLEDAGYEWSQKADKWVKKQETVEQPIKVSETPPEPSGDEIDAIDEDIYYDEDDEVSIDDTDKENVSHIYSYVGQDSDDLRNYLQRFNQREQQELLQYAKMMSAN